MTSSTGDDATPLELLVEEFLERQRRGEHPAISEYTAAYPELADEIRELLPVLAMVERFKPVPQELAGTPSLVDRSDLGPGCGRLGDYRLLRMIDVGGMGIVYEAERESLACRVALKVIKPEFRSSASYLRRFHTEAARRPACTTRTSSESSTTANTTASTTMRCSTSPAMVWTSCSTTCAGSAEPRPGRVRPSHRRIFHVGPLC